MWLVSGVGEEGVSPVSSATPTLMLSFSVTFSAWVQWQGEARPYLTSA